VIRNIGNEALNKKYRRECENYIFNSSKGLKMKAFII